MPSFIEDETTMERVGQPGCVGRSSAGAVKAPGGGRGPSHVGLIMDGNGRWASARGLPRIEGHRRGLDALRGAVRAAIEFNLAYLTVYSFSAENWSRPLDEVRDLMGLLKRFIRKDLIELHRADVRVKVIGHRANLQPDIRGLLEEAETTTRMNQGLTLVVAFNYGGRQEIAAAVRDIARMLAAGAITESDIDERLLSRHLDTADIPDPDLIIRTSGEQRLSNFLLWQAAYSEFVFLPVLWPDFDRGAFAAALAEYAARDRRFGGVSAPREVSVRTGS
jgi:undecaprenyl diphosphate synthase